jgi:hypothetical protein
LPRILHPQALPATDLRVASNFASFSTSGAQAPGCPTALLLQLCLSMSRQVAPASASSGVAGDGSSSCLESRILQRIRRISSRVAPQLCSSDCACRCIPLGRPGFCIFRLCRRRISELPRVSRPSAPLVLMLMLWVTPRHCSSSCASRWVCELPRSPHLPALPWV